MSRATFVYIVMLSVFGAGLWAILSFGSILLHAPEDLAGTWKFTLVGEPQRSMNVSVEQSGRFFKIGFNSAKPETMKLNHESPPKMTRVEWKELHLSGEEGLTMTWLGAAGSDEFTVRMTGRHVGNWIADRTQRTYPRSPGARRGQPPARPTTMLSESPPHAW